MSLRDLAEKRALLLEEAESLSHILEGVTEYNDKDMGSGGSETRLRPNALPFTTLQDALTFAKTHQYQLVVKLPMGQYYFKYKKTDGRTIYDDIINGLTAATERKIWIIKYD